MRVRLDPQCVLWPGTPDRAACITLTRTFLVAFHRKYFKPDLLQHFLTIFYLQSSAPARTIPLARIARATPEATRPTTLLVEVAPEKAPKSAPRAEAETLRLTFARAQDATAWGTAVAAAQARVREDERQKMLRALEREKEAVRAKQAEKAQKEDERLREEKRERRQSRRRSAQPLVQG